ncbi:unnamed protein product [Somion occarium]|uniref:Copper homeostasis protein cutC homolog n=1 Tax=Somion occarium TaxID=3059160 RepID=A0ABP1CIH6_9APHY
MSSSKPFIIEVCIDSVESAIAAVNGGANRLELCANIGLGGGTTPSLGLFTAVQRAVPSVPIMIMIRSRTGDFLYTEHELDVMIEDIRVFKAADAHGVVLGVLTADGDIDVPHTTRLVNEGLPLEVCFHRAFDMTRDTICDDEGNYISPKSLEQIASIPGITGILTSGHQKTAPEASLAIRGLLQHASTLNREREIPLTILPGSGINPTTVCPLLKELLPIGLREIHLSAGNWVPTEMRYRRNGMGMGVGGEGEWGIWKTKEEKVREVRAIVDSVLREVQPQSH